LNAPVDWDSLRNLDFASNARSYSRSSKTSIWDWLRSMRRNAKVSVLAVAFDIRRL
jgi:hypothetical protein